MSFSGGAALNRRGGSDENKRPTGSLQNQGIGSHGVVTEPNLNASDSKFILGTLGEHRR